MQRRRQVLPSDSTRSRTVSEAAVSNALAIPLAPLLVESPPYLAHNSLEMMTEVQPVRRRLQDSKESESRLSLLKARLRACCRANCDSSLIWGLIEAVRPGHGPLI